MFTLAMILPSLAGLVGLTLAGGAAGPSAGWRIVGGVVVGLAAICLLALAWQLLRPRVARRDGHLLVYLRWSGPVRVPLELVEGFLLGQGPSRLAAKNRRELETTTVVIRLAERAPEWARVDVDPLLGNWCGHYITIRGTFCEPINLDLVNRLNARLHEATHANRGQAVS
ncbi:MAG TPA: hypothetical protein VIK18_01975 [Pirellulales bacterium]